MEAIEVQIRPLHDRVLVLPDKPEEKTKSGLFLPPPTDDSKKKTFGTVVAVGSSVEAGPVVPGARVMWGDYSGSPLIYEGTEYVIMREYDIMGLVNEEE